MNRGPLLTGLRGRGVCVCIKEPRLGHTPGMCNPHDCVVGRFYGAYDCLLGVVVCEVVFFLPVGPAGVSPGW